MKVEEKILKNGAKIIGVSMPAANSIVISFGFRTGSRTETDDIAGISHFLEHMVFKGSKKRPSADLISKAADNIGAQYNAYTGKEYTVYYIKTSVENFDLALDIVGDMITRPILLEREIQKEKGTILEELKRSEDNPSMNIFDRIDNVLFGNNEMGREIIGYPKSIAATNDKKMKAYYKKYYNGSNCRVVIAGNLPKNYQKEVSGYANRLPLGKRTGWKKVGFNSNNLDVKEKDTKQAQIGIAIPTYSIFDDKHYIVQVISKILGGYMSSRLFTAIREKRGWAYHIETGTDESSDHGYIAIFGGIKKDKVSESVAIIKKELLDFEKTVTDEEIERAVENIKGSSALKFDSPEEVGNFVMARALLTDKVQLPRVLVEKTSKVTKNDIREVAKELFTENKLHLAVIGPFKDKKKFAKILAK